MKRKFLRVIFGYLILCFLLVITGCTSSPDISNYSEETIKLQKSVKSSGEVLVQELDYLVAAYETAGADFAKIKIVKSKQDLEKEWEHRNKAMSAIVDYSASLEAIIQSGNQGSKNVQELAEPLENLADAANLVNPATGDAVTETAWTVYAEIAALKTKKSLDATKPIITDIVEVLKDNLSKSDEIINLVHEEQVNELNTRYETTILYRPIFKKKIKNKYGQFEVALAEGKDISSLEKDFKRIQKILQPLDEEWTAYEKEFKEINDRKIIADKLIRLTSDALAAWEKSHNKLIDSVNTEESFDVRELTNAVKEIQELIKKV